MPYQSLKDLPKGVQHVLPEHAEEIYLAAFNSAYEEYKEPSKRRGDESREVVAHKVAWAAVEHVYEKDALGKWVKKVKTNNL